MMRSIGEAHDAESWHYRGEGAANVVLAYRGDEPALIGKVLRLRKAVKNEKGVANGVQSTPVLSVEEQRVWADWPDLVATTTSAELNHAYARDVLSPLLGEDHVDPGTLVYISATFVEALNRHIGHKRPVWRAESGSLQVSSGIGLLISDHTWFSAAAGMLNDSPHTISVEIKPKCGFLPMSPFISDDNHVKRVVSRFTMHQQLKFNQGKITQLSKYDPLDLFSGTKDGILKAVLALFDTPQNNLRIFRNGEEVFGQSEEFLESKNLSLSCLEDVLEGFLPAQSGGRVQAFQKLIVDLLYESDILTRLLAVQRLDHHDIEGAIQAHNEFLACLKISLESVSTCQNSVKVVENPVLCLEALEFQGEATNFSERNFTVWPPSFEDCRKVVRDFMISTTAKDCGLMLTLQPLDQQNVDGMPPGMACVPSDQKYQHKILFLDLDLKRVKKMQHYYELDQEIVKGYKFSHPL